MSKITIIDDLHPEDNAMLQALQSRSPASVEERLKKVGESGSGRFMERFYINYGHKSIGDCGNTTIFIEGVTMLMAKAIQDWPLYSGQEASTRYMDFSNAKFYNPLGTASGEQIQEAWREAYLGAQEPVREHLREKYPRQEGEDEVVWERAINARSFDILRSFLPAGAATNLSWSTNLRQAQDHLKWLAAHPDPGITLLALKIYGELKERYPHSFTSKEALPGNFMIETMRDHYFWDDMNGPVAIDANFCQSDLPEKTLDLLRKRPRGQEVPWFMAEYGTITSWFMLDFGSFRDLQRHRNGTVRMPLLTTRHGFHPWYINELPTNVLINFLDLLKEQEERIGQLDCSDSARQNYIAMGYRVPCRVTQPLPGFVYRLELRSGKTVHPTLREVVHKEILQFQKLFPAIILHVDMDPDSWTVRRGKQTIEEKTE